MSHSRREFLGAASALGTDLLAQSAAQKRSQTWPSPRTKALLDWFGLRVLRNSTFLTWEAAGCPQPGNRPGEGDHVFTRNGVKILRYDSAVPLVGSAGHLSEAAMYAGMGVGEVKDLPSAGDLVARLWSETETAHRLARR